MGQRTKIILRSHFMSEIVTIIKISDRPSQQSHHTRVNDYSISFDFRLNLKTLEYLDFLFCPFSQMISIEQETS